MRFRDFVLALAYLLGLAVVFLAAVLYVRGTS